MRESDRRIREYKKILPHLKEKVMTAAFLFAIAAIMMVAVSFAWISLSTNPEVKGIATTISANGNLEIALSDTDGLEPDDSMVGDSGKDILKKNLTWGNLVNLSHEAYGLEHITLRPAALDTRSLLDNPLYAVAYGKDGRVSTLKSDFAYSNYDKENNVFTVSGTTTSYGVRAISSVTYEALGAENRFFEGLRQANTNLNTTIEAYKTIMHDQDLIDSLGTVIGKYLTQRMNSDNAELNNQDFSGDIPLLYDLMLRFKDDCMVPAGETLVSMANLQILMNNAETYETYAYKSLDELLNDSNPSSRGVNLPILSKYRTYSTNLDKHIATMKSVYDDVYGEGKVATRTVAFSEIQAPMNFMVNINSTTVEGHRADSIGMQLAMDLLSIEDEKGYVDVVLKQGMIKDFEQFVGVDMGEWSISTSVSVTVSRYGITIPASITGVISTAADPEAYEIPAARDEIVDSKPGQFVGGTPVAEDTYGMALDFWVRTNADNSYLVLEGNSLTKTVHRQDEDGYLYYTDENGIEYVFKDNNYYLSSDRETALSEEDLSEITLEPLNDLEVLGYEGENRIWDDDSLSQNSATQGMGSCYVFYAEPQDQRSILNLLEAVHVAFISEEGKILAYADMDTAMNYSESGRVTVPLKLRSSETYYLDENGSSVYAITQLQRGVAERITAIIYVDGTKLTNEQVMASEDLQGQLNIQFGSSVDLNPLYNEMKYDEIHISASANPTDFSTYVPGNTATTTVTLTIDGDIEPSEVTASFIRKINSTQGSIQDEMVFTSLGDGKWQATMEFGAPGDYVLRTAWIDGVEYQLDSEVALSLPGFSVDKVSWDFASNSIKKMTGETSASTNVNVTIAGNAKPSSVKAVFSNEYNQQITVNMQPTSVDWKGTANFTTSGTYKLQYVIIDNEYYEIPESEQKTLELSLGMKIQANVSKSEYVYSFEENTTENNIQVFASIYDDKGNEFTNADVGNNVDIYFNSATSNLTNTGLHSELKWNSSKQMFEGEFYIPSPGAYSFAYVTIDDSNTIATGEAPTIYAKSPNPPEYSGHKEFEAYVPLLKTSPVATIEVGLTNAGGIANSDVVAVMVSGDRTEYIKANEKPTGDNDEMIYTFNIPSDGEWTLTELRLSGVYINETGSFSSSASPYIIDLADENIISEVETMNISTTSSDMTLTDQFMVTQTLDADDLQIRINNNNGNALKYAPEYIEVEYALTVLASGYDSDMTSIQSSEKPTVILKKSSSDPTIYEAEAGKTLSFTYAGTYTVNAVRFDIGTTTYTTAANETGTTQITMNNAMPKYTVAWSTPVVKFTAVSPSGTFKTYNGSSYKDGKNAFSDYNVEVYFQASSGWFFGTYYNYTASRATTKLTDAGNVESATCTIIDEPNSGAYNVVFTYNSSNNFTSSQLIGKVVSKTLATDTKYHLAGSQAKTVTLVKGSVTYTFELQTPLTVDAKSKY